MTLIVAADTQYMTSSRTKTTSVFDIGLIRPEFTNFLSDTKRQYTLHLTMIDSTTRENVLDCAIGKTVSCLWCRHRFDWAAIGCPLRYVPSKIFKTLQSPVTNESYVIKENVSDHDISRTGSAAATESYYETDGVFCSFSCCLAYTNEKAGIAMYHQSKSLLMNMYYHVNELHAKGDISDSLKPAPSWRLLKEYGGHLPIDEFRRSFSKTDFVEAHIVKHVPRLKPVGVLYESKKQL